MKLTNYHREAFVAAVLLDIPSNDHSAQFKKLVEDDMLAVSPPKIAAVLKDSALRSYVLTGHDTYRAPDSRWEHCVSSVAVFRGYEMSPTAKEAAKLISASARAQYELREHIKEQVKAVIRGCTTLKTAHERLPEFAKYLPVEEVKGTMLPAIANLAADLMKMGWPKDAGTPVAA